MLPNNTWDSNKASYALSESFELIWDRNRLQVLETGFRGVTAAF
jgi:hypothetical protein